MTSDSTKCVIPWPKWGMALSIFSIVLAVFAWFYMWAHNEYHACGGVSARLGFLYLPEIARRENSVYSSVSQLLLHRGLWCGAAVFPVSIVAMILCASSRAYVRILSTIGLAMVLLPIFFILVRTFW